MSRCLDPIQLVELGYAVRTDPCEWMRAMVEPISRCLVAGAATGRAFRIGPSGPQDAVSWTSATNEAQALAEPRGPFDRGSPQTRLALAAAVALPGLTSWLEIAGSPPGGAFIGEGYVDASVVIVHMADGLPAVFAAPCRERYRVDPTQRSLWRTLATHLGAASASSCRARSRYTLEADSLVTSERRGEHACDVASDCLRRAVQRVDRARTREGRSDPHAALELWQGLFSGRWSLVDHFDSDGRRFLLGRRNCPDSAVPALPRRQREVLYYVAIGWSNKEVGYAMGIREPTVAAHLHRALAAIGVASRSEWIRISAELAAAAVAQPPIAARPL